MSGAKIRLRILRDVAFYPSDLIDELDVIEFSYDILEFHRLPVGDPEAICCGPIL